MIATASRSRDYLRTKGYTAEVVEHRRGPIRVDLHGVADVHAFRFRPLKNILMAQAYLWKDRKKHLHLHYAYRDAKDSRVISNWIDSGGTFEHHIFKKTRKVITQVTKTYNALTRRKGKKVTKQKVWMIAKFMITPTVDLDVDVKYMQEHVIWEPVTNKAS